MSVQTANFPAALKGEVPLVVDVDGALLATDLLQEAALQFVAKFPLQAFRIPLWLAGGKSNLKRQLANRVDVRIETVPLRQEVLALIRDAQATGRPVFLASASDRRYIEKLAERIGGIAGVFGTDFGRKPCRRRQSGSTGRRVWCQGIRLCWRHASRLRGMAPCA